MTKRILTGSICYLLPTFVLGFVWHLIAFKGFYDALAMYRKDVIIPFGLLSMCIQGALFAWVYSRGFAHLPSLKTRALRYSAFGSVLSWSFTTIAVAAKNVMTSVPQYLVIETGYTVAQWLLVGPLTALALSRPERATRASA